MSKLLYEKLSSLPKSQEEEVLDFIEFLLLKNKKQNMRIKKQPKAGFLKGVITISEDFDEYEIRRIW